MSGGSPPFIGMGTVTARSVRRGSLTFRGSNLGHKRGERRKWTGFTKRHTAARMS